MSSVDAVIDDTNIFNIQIADDLTWNVQPLLHEINHALTDLIESGTTHVIDLRSIPLAPGEETRIIEALGEGEVKATLNALGPTEVIETAYTGVWLITHYNENGDTLSKLIEITPVPEILLAPRVDMSQARDRLTRVLNEQQDAR